MVGERNNIKILGESCRKGGHDRRLQYIGYSIDVQTEDILDTHAIHVH